MTKQKSHIIFGIDIGSQKTRLAIVEHFNVKEIGQKIFPNILYLKEVETEGVFNGNIINEKEVADTILNLFKDIPNNLLKKKKHILISLNAAGIHSIYNSASILNTNLTGEISEALVESLAEEAKRGINNLKNIKIIETIPIKYKIDQMDTRGSPVGMLGKRLEGKFLFISCPILYFEKLENIFNSLNLEIDDFITSPFVEADLLLTKKEKIAGTAIVNFGHSTTSILIYENDIPIFISIIPYGSNNITNDIALGLSVSLEDAEEIKCGRSNLSFSKRRLEEIIEARIADISEKINLELSKINRKGLLPGGIIILGGGSELMRSDYLFKYYLKLPVKFANEELIKKTNKQLADTNFAKAVGITYFAPIITEEYIIKKLLKKLSNKIISIFKKIIP